MTDSDLAKDFEAAYQQAINVWNPWLTEAEKDLEFRMGKQWSASDQSKLKLQQREALVFNRIRRMIHLISGYERKNRLSLRIDPIEGNPKTAGQFSSLVLWLMNVASGYVIMSEAFDKGALTMGLNLVELYLDYDDDPIYGDVKFHRVPYNEVLLDPYFTRQDLGDCRYLLRRRWVSKDAAKLLLPGNDKDIDNLTPRGRDGKFLKAPPAKDFRGNDLLRYDQFFRRETKTVKMLFNSLTGKVSRHEGGNLNEFLASPVAQLGGRVNWGQILEVESRTVETVRMGVMLEQEVFYNGDDPTGLDDYPFVAVLGYFEPEYDQMEWKLQGLVRAARDPQTESNRRRLKILDIFDSAISAGVKAKPGSLVDREAAYHSGQGRVVWINDDKDMADFEVLRGSEVPAGLFQIQAQMDKDSEEVLGINSETIGSPNKDDAQEAFVLAKLRQSAGLTIFQPLMDGFRDAKKQLGQKLVRLIQIHFGPEKIQRLLNEQPTEEFYNREFGKYDCVPTEGILTDSQRQMAFGQAIALQRAGAPIPWSWILKLSPLEMKEDMLKIMEQQEKMQSQVAAQKMQSDMIMDKLTLAMEQAKLAQAEASFAKAGSDRAKTMAEIEGMSHDRLVRLIELALQIEQQGAFGMTAPAKPGPQVPPGASIPITTR